MINLTITQLKFILLIPNLIFIFLFLKYLLKKYNIYFTHFIGGQLVLLSIFLEFYFYGNHNSYEWVTSGDIPILLRLEDETNLKFDFYTSAIFNSPKIIFYYIIYLFIENFNLGLDYTLFLFKSIQIFLIPLLAYYVLTGFINLKNDYLIILLTTLIILFSSGYFDFILHYARIGIGSFTSWKSLSPQTFSFVLGLTSILLYRNNFYIFSLILLFIVSIVHIFSGLVFLILHFILFDNLDNKKNYFLFLLTKIYKMKYHFLIFLSAMLIIKNYFVNEIPENFFEIYVLERHPHHYLISSFFNLYSFLFISIPGISILVANYLNKKILIYQSLNIFLFFYLCMLIQYFGSEVLQLNFITLLGPTRLLSISIFLIVYLFIQLLNSFFEND
tara:strand:- start:101 stop:1264 length:1164 start_codon:yes stop_codon:yes gene_type:complete